MGLKGDSDPTHEKFCLTFSTNSKKWRQKIIFLRESKPSSERPPGEGRGVARLKEVGGGQKMFAIKIQFMFLKKRGKFQVVGAY